MRIMCRVLVAEDDSDMRSLVVEALSRDGHSVVEASDGGGVLVRLAQAFDRDPSLVTIDVIVSDIRMPMCSGLDIVERVFHARWKVRCILMTAFGDDETRQRAAAVGALLLDKPLRLDDLCAAVRHLVRP